MAWSTAGHFVRLSPSAPQGQLPLPESDRAARRARRRWIHLGSIDVRGRGDLVRLRACAQG